MLNKERTPEAPADLLTYAVIPWVWVFALTDSGLQRAKGETSGVSHRHQTVERRPNLLP